MAALNIEIPDELKSRLVEYAADNGISQAAATRLLLNDALAASGYPRKEKQR